MESVLLKCAQIDSVANTVDVEVQEELSGEVVAAAI
jgi:hypothetical protein